MSQRAIETLMRDRAKLILQKHEIQIEIFGIEAAIETISGKKVWENERELLYDGENRDYITNTEDGI